jgi:hypothetical protein
MFNIFVSVVIQNARVGGDVGSREIRAFAGELIYTHPVAEGYYRQIPVFDGNGSVMTRQALLDMVPPDMEN